LQKCKGWKEDSSKKYTLNYIIFVIFAEAKSNNRLIQDTRNNFFILSDASLKQALDLNFPVVCLSDIRKFVLNQVIHLELPSFGHRYPFWCLPAAAYSVFASLFKEDEDFQTERLTVIRNKLVLYQCRL
jgi:hypothetical protein